MNEKAKMKSVSVEQQHRIDEIRKLFSGAYNFIEHFNGKAVCHA